MTVHWRKLLVLALALTPAWGAAQERGNGATGLDKLAPFLDAQTVAVAHLDIRQVEVKAAIDFLAGKLPADLVSPQQKAEAVAKGTEIREQFLSLGFTNAYLVVSLADLPQSGPFAVFPMERTAKPEAFQELLRSLGHRTRAEVIHDAMVVGPDATLARIRENKPTARPDLAKALLAAGDAALRLAVSPSDDTRRGLRETLPPLPEELGGQSGAELTDSFQWLAAGANPPPNLSLKVTLQAKDAGAAQQLQTTVGRTLELLAKNEQVQREFPPIKGLTPLLLPKVQESRLVLKIDEQEGNLTKIIDELVTPAVASARQSARRMQSSNNLRQLMLGMHTYHDRFRSFPARAIRKDDKQLLSWRVHLLPYLEENALYEQFHLDEPWDSEHNKKLIAKMPKVFAGRGLTAEQLKQGMTTYVVPVGPKTVFEGTEGNSLAKIRDGSSNTIAIVEVSPEHAVVWTQPEDWSVDFSDVFKGLLGKPAKEKPAAADMPPAPSGFLSAFCDGSVHFIAATVDKETLRRLLQKDDGEVIGDF